MRRRELTGWMLATTAAPALVPNEARADVCGQPCYPQTAEESRATPGSPAIVPAHTIYSPRPSLDVARYGASPAETAANNSAAIQRALQLIRKKGGGAITFADTGNYKVADSIALPNCCIVEGAGWGHTSLTMTAAKDMFVISGRAGRNEIREIALVGYKKSAAGVLLGDAAGSPGVNLFRRVMASGFERAFLLGGTAWTRFEQCEAFENVYGWQIHAQTASSQNNAITWADCIGRDNDKSGIGATYVPVKLKGLNVRGGSFENNCRTVLEQGAQLSFGNACAVVVDGAYFEYSPDGAKPTAIEAAGITGGSISNCYFNGAQYGVRDSRGGEARDLSIHNNYFDAIAKDCINIRGGTRVMLWSNGGSSNSFVVSGPGSRDWHADVRG